MGRKRSHEDGNAGGRLRGKFDSSPALSRPSVPGQLRRSPYRRSRFGLGGTRGGPFVQLTARTSGRPTVSPIRRESNLTQRSAGRSPPAREIRCCTGRSASAAWLSGSRRRRHRPIRAIWDHQRCAPVHLHSPDCGVNSTRSRDCQPGPRDTWVLDTWPSPSGRAQTAERSRQPRAREDETARAVPGAGTTALTLTPARAGIAFATRHWRGVLHVPLRVSYRQRGSRSWRIAGLWSRVGQSCIRSPTGILVRTIGGSTGSSRST